MATSNLLVVPQTASAFTITMTSLANGSARQSTLLTNTSPGYPAALIHVQLTSGATAPTANNAWEVYLLRSDGTVADDNAGASDAAITIENAPLLGTMVVTATTNKKFYGVFDTSVFGPLGTTWGVAVKNNTGASANGTAGNHVVDYVYYNVQAQ